MTKKRKQSVATSEVWKAFYGDNKGEYLEFQLPDQRLLTSEKDEHWITRCANALDMRRHIFREQYIDRDDLVRNELLIAGNPDQDEIEEVCNLYNLPYDKTHKFYDIITPKINILLNEVFSLRREYKASLINSEAVSLKEKEMLDKTKKFMESLVMQPGITEAEAKEKLMSFQDYMLYDYRDIREEYAQSIMKYYSNELYIDDMFSEAFMDLLTAKTFIFALDTEYNTIKLRKCNLLTTSVWMPLGETDLRKLIAIQEVDYMTEAEILIHFGDVITEEDLKDIRTRYNDYSGIFAPKFTTSNIISIGTRSVTDKYSNETIEMNYDNPPVDKRGYVRVLRQTWLSQRKLLRVHSIDPSTGFEMVRDEDENYIIDDTKGEWCEEIWVPEYWKNTRIGFDIDVRNGPAVQQFRKQDNYGDVCSGYYGMIGLINDKRTPPILSRVRAYAYQFNVFANKFFASMKRDKGKIPLIDKETLPNDYQGREDEWFEEAFIAGFGMIDGSKNRDVLQRQDQKRTLSEILDFTQDADIKKSIDGMQYTIKMIDEAMGITPPRMGQTQSGDGLGVMQEAKDASMVLTRNLYITLDRVKRDLLCGIVDMSKVVLNNKNKTLQIVTSDMAQSSVKIDIDALMDADIGIFVTNNTNNIENEKTFKELIKYGLTTKAITPSEAGELTFNDSVHSGLRKLKAKEKQREEAESNNSKREFELNQKQKEFENTIKQQELEIKKKELELKELELRYKLQMNSENNESKERIAEAKNYTDVYTSSTRATGFQNDADVNKNNISDVKEATDMALEGMKQNSEIFKMNLKKQELEHKKTQDNEQNKQDEIALYLKAMEMKK